VFAESEDGELAFHPLAHLTNDDVRRLPPGASSSSRAASSAWF
jgi:hypothetical protein